MGKIYKIAMKEINDEQEKCYEKAREMITEIKIKKDKDEISDKEFNALLSEAVLEYVGVVDKLIKIEKTNGKAWNFEEEKLNNIFAFDDTLLLTPLDEEYYDLYIKTRAEYAYNSKFYLNPKNRTIVTSELRQEESLFMAVLKKKDSSYIGYVGLKDTTKDIWEFCIELLPKYCNLGHGYNAIKLFLKKISEITKNDNQQFMALVENDNIPSQKLMSKLNAILVGVYDFIFHDVERARKFEEDHLDEITDHMIELAGELNIEPRKLLSHALDYRIFVEKL